MPRAGHPAWSLVSELALALPGVAASTSYGTPAFKVRGKLLARLHQDSEALVVRVDPLHREVLMESTPNVFFVTDHYVGYPWVLVRLATVHRDQLAAVLRESWQELSSERAPPSKPEKPPRPTRRRAS
jgi:hypothetical protein